MASSGSKTVNVTDHNRLEFIWSEVSQSVENNTTTISWRMDLAADTYGYIDSSPKKNWNVVVNGTAYSGSVSVGIAGGGRKTLASNTTTITHNADGSKVFAFSFSQYFGITFSGEYIGTISGTGSGTLDTIARASQPSCITWPEHTQNVGYFGDTISIHMNRNSSSFTHSVRYQFGSQSGTIATGVGTGTTWTIPNSLMNLIPNSLSGSGTIYVDTYNGSTKIGTKYCGFTAKVPDSVKPSCTFTLEDILRIDEIYGSPVKGLSKIKVTVTAQAAYGSAIDSCTITANGVNYSGLTATTDFLRTAGTSKVTATVKDKRGRTGTVSYDMKVLDYAKPTVTALSVHRCNEDGTENDRGEYIKLTFSASVSSMSSKNTAQYYMDYKKPGDSSWSRKVFTDLENQYSVSKYSAIVAATSNSSYDIEVYAKDRHNNVYRATSASTAFTLLNFHPSGTGIGVGQVCEKENTMQVALDFEIGGKTIVDLIYPVGSIYLAYNHTNPGTLFPGTTWARIYGAFPWFTDGNGQIGLTGGEREVTLKVDNLPAHNHGGTYTNAGTARTHAWLASGGTAMGYDTVNTGGGVAHNNMPPYIQIAAWRRTA